MEITDRLNEWHKLKDANIGFQNKSIWHCFPDCLIAKELGMADFGGKYCFLDWSSKDVGHVCFRLDRTDINKSRVSTVDFFTLNFKIKDRKYKSFLKGMQEALMHTYKKLPRIVKEYIRQRKQYKIKNDKMIADAKEARVMADKAIAREFKKPVTDPNKKAKKKKHFVF